MFKLVYLFLGFFAVVKADSQMPLNSHGFIRVDFTNEEGYHAILSSKISKELQESGELEDLQKEAIDFTEEAVAEEFNLA